MSDMYFKTFFKNQGLVEVEICLNIHLQVFKILLQLLKILAEALRQETI